MHASWPRILSSFATQNGDGRPLGSVLRCTGGHRFRTLAGREARERLNTAARSAPRPAAVRKRYTLTARIGSRGPAAGLLGRMRCRIPERALNADEVLERWRRRALLLAGPMKFGAELVNETSEIIRLVFGPRL